MEKLISLAKKAKAAGRKDVTLTDIKVLAIALGEDTVVSAIEKAGVKELVAYKKLVANVFGKDKADKVSEGEGNILGLSGKDAKIATEDNKKIFEVKPEEKLSEDGKDMEARKVMDHKKETSDTLAEKPSVDEPLKVKNEFKEVTERGKRASLEKTEMGKSYTPTFVINVNDFQVFPTQNVDPMAWDTKYSGKPTEENIKKWVEMYNASLEPDGVNSHVGRSAAVYGGSIKNQKTGDIVAHWEDINIKKMYQDKPKFEVASLEKNEAVGEKFQDLFNRLYPNHKDISDAELANLIVDKGSEETGLSKALFNIDRVTKEIPELKKTYENPPKRGRPKKEDGTVDETLETVNASKVIKTASTASYTLTIELENYEAVSKRMPQIIDSLIAKLEEAINWESNGKTIMHLKGNDLKADGNKVSSLNKTASYSKVTSDDMTAIAGCQMVNCKQYNKSASSNCNMGGIDVIEDKVSGNAICGSFEQKSMDKVVEKEETPKPKEDAPEVAKVGEGHLLTEKEVKDAAKEATLLSKVRSTLKGVLAELGVGDVVTVDNKNVTIENVGVTPDNKKALTGKDESGQTVVVPEGTEVIQKEVIK